MSEIMESGNTEMVSFSNYNDFKIVMDAEISEAAAGFVRIGYLLKMAKETDILSGSPYHDVNEFAQREYGLTRDMVSRYIDINTKYSEGGCSDRLQEKYRAYGYSKLAEMLTLPDYIAEEISPDYTRAEIREIKAELKEEEKTTDLELMIERQQDTNNLEEDLLHKLMHEYFREHPSEWMEIWEIMWNTVRTSSDSVSRKLIEVLAPSGTATLIIRIPGTGRYLVSIREDKEEITIKNMRDETFCQIYTWEQLDDCMDNMCGDIKWTENDCTAAWEERYSLPFPKQPEPKKEEAPNWPAKETKKQQKKESKVKKSAPKQPEPKKEESVAAVKEEIAPAQQDENTIKTECEPEIEKVAGEVVEAYTEDIKFEPVASTETQNTYDKRTQMLIETINDDLKKLNQMIVEEKWTGAKLATIDLQIQLEQLVTWITRKEESENANEQ